MHLQSHVIVSCGERLVQYFGSSSVFGQELRKVQAYGSWVEYNTVWVWLRMGEEHIQRIKKSHVGEEGWRWSHQKPSMITFTDFYIFLSVYLPLLFILLDQLFKLNYGAQRVTG